MGDDLERLKQRIPLLDYLRKQNWIGRPTGRASEVVGLCLLHPETRPSFYFYVNTRKNVFYCHGWGKGGDLIRLVELSRSSLLSPERRLSRSADSSGSFLRAGASH